MNRVAVRALVALTVLLPLLPAPASAAASSTAPATAGPDRSRPPKAAPVRPFVIEKPVELALKNGMKVHFLKRTRAPLVDVVAVVDAGALWDPDGKVGLANWTAQMLSQGAGGRDTFAFDDAVRGMGAQVFASADWQGAQVALHAPANKLQSALPLFADALLRPRFDADAWERKQGEVGGELMFLQNEPKFLGALAAQRAQYGARSRLGWNLGGTLPSLQSTKASDLKAFHRAHYRPDTTFLVVVGDVEQKALMPLLEATFAGFVADGPRPTINKPAEPGAIANTDVILVDNPGAAQSVLRVVAPAPVDLQSLDPGVEVMSTLLGGSFTSRLNNNLREVHGYSYGAGFSVQTDPTHAYVVSTSVATPVTIPAISEILVELARIREPATAEEIERARSYAALSFPSIFDGGRSTAFTWAEWRQLAIPDARITGFMDGALKADATAVAAMGKRIVDEKKVHIVVVGDASKIAADLARFGKVTRLSVDALLPPPTAPGG